MRIRGVALLLIAAALLTGAPAAAASLTDLPAGALAEIPAADRAVTFTVDGTLTYGTLHLPAHRPGQRLAAALLLPGSGPTDRDGNEPPSYTPDTLALIADVLGGQGVATLRFDKYFTGQTGAGAYAADPGRYDLAAQVRQADAAYRVLAAQPETNPADLLVVGHSEGGFTGVLVAESVRPRPVGLALLEPQDLRLLDLVGIQLGEQLDAAVAAGQLTAAVAQANKTAIARVIAEFRAGQPVDTTGLLPSIAALFTDSLFSAVNANFVRTDDAAYPPAVAARLPRSTSVLVTDGTADTNVPPDTLGPLLAALRGTRGPGLTALPDVDHYLHPAGTPVNDQILAPSAIAALTAFAQRFTRW